MPRKTKTAAAAGAALPPIPSELVDQFVTGPMTAEAVNDISLAFKRALIERALGAELSHHLGYRPGAAKPDQASNHRNGSSGKTVLTDTGPLRIEVPRDREGSFEPLLIPKHERRFTGLDDKIVAMYARGMTMREIQGFLGEQYGCEVSPEFISSVTDAVMAEVTAWQARALEPMYPVVFFDALRVKIREEAVVRNKAIYLALGVLPDGSRDVLGLWKREHRRREVLAQGLQRPEDPRRGRHPDRRHRWPEGHRRGAGRGVCGHHTADLHRAPDPQLAGLCQLEAAQAAGCGLAPGVHRAPSAEVAAAELEAFERGPWGQRFPTVGAAWRRAWDRVIPFFAYPPAMRRLNYTTNAIESLHSQLRKIIKTRGHFPSDEAATKLIWLALRNITAERGKSVREWREAMHQFAIAYGDRFTRPAA